VGGTKTFAFDLVRQILRWKEQAESRHAAVFDTFARV
jgi:hypothetical protein